MSHRSIEALVDHFKVRYVMDLLYDPVIREQIKHFRFYYQGKERYITKKNNEYWCLQSARLGEWVQYELDEQTFKEFKINDGDWFALVGLPIGDFTELEDEVNDYTKYNTEDKAITEEEKPSELIAAMFIASTVCVIAGHIYRSWNPIVPTKK